MRHLVLAAAVGGMVAAAVWLGADREDRLTHTLVRPAVMALLGLLMLVLLSGEPLASALAATAAGVGLWESYTGVYHLLYLPIARTGPVAQVRTTARWLLNTLINLVLLNLSAQLAFPDTFAWRDLPATALDVAYFTLLTFASGGYGDVLPGTPLGKLLAMLTSLSGLLFATILFAALFNRLRAE
ncbi:MAG: potassium channel family protein [Symbiobacterium sp.]|uniref:potassium channel family protein n=1 Tax=Symbiobacterium sp. TaxID=1971213 RepID=UPI003464C6FF